MAWRYIAQDLPSGAFVDWDLPLTGVQITRTLSGPGRLTGTIPVEVARLLGPDGQPVLRPWGTAVWAEVDGQIRGGGILTPLELDGPALSVDCVGFSGYPQGMPWTGDARALVDVDPLDIVRTVWAHLQSYPAGNLGVVVDTTASPVRVGEPEKDVSLTTGAGEDVEFQTGPFRLEWWSTHDLGQVIDDLAADTPFDYLEHTAWDGDDLVHRLQLGYPTIGSRRPDLRFAVGENVTVSPATSADDDDYASDVLALGAGEGKAMVRAAVHRDGPGLRRVHVYTDKTARSTTTLANAARRELDRLTGRGRLTTLTVADHPHARLGSFDVGDEIPIVGRAGWADLDTWGRVVELVIEPEQSDRMTVTIQEV